MPSVAVCRWRFMEFHGLLGDIDLLIPEESLASIRPIVSELGYQIEAGWMNLAGGDIRMFRVTKIDSEMAMKSLRGSGQDQDDLKKLAKNI